MFVNPLDDTPPAIQMRRRSKRLAGHERIPLARAPFEQFCLQGVNDDYKRSAACYLAKIRASAAKRARVKATNRRQNIMMTPATAATTDASGMSVSGPMYIRRISCRAATLNVCRLWDGHLEAGIQADFVSVAGQANPRPGAKLRRAAVFAGVRAACRGRRVSLDRDGCGVAATAQHTNFATQWSAKRRFS